METTNWESAVGEEMYDAWGNLLGIVTAHYWVENSDKRMFPVLALDNGAEIDVTYMKLEA